VAPSHVHAGPCRDRHPIRTCLHRIAHK
jgi:hypothetical protein